MTSPHPENRWRGAVLGSALGDTLGSPFEFQPVTLAHTLGGAPWISALHGAPESTGPHHAWGSPPPRAAGTDDVRYHAVFLRQTLENHRPPTPAEYAQRVLHIHAHPDAHFPAFPSETRQQWAPLVPCARGFLGMSDPQYPQLSPAELHRRSFGLPFPVLLGLISFPTYGLLRPGAPHAAYSGAFRLGFHEIGYAAEVNGFFAALLALAAIGAAPRDALQTALALNPMSLGNMFEGPYVAHRLPAFLRDLDAFTGNHQALAHWLSARFSHTHPFDPYRSLCIALAALLRCDGDGLRALLIAVNITDAHPQSPTFMDIDCYGSITGALVGAFHGDDAFPPDLLTLVQEVNHAHYGIDLESLARGAAAIASPHP